MLPLPDSSYTKAHPGGLQDRPHSRPVHLAAQPGATVFAAVLESRRMSVNALPPPSRKPATTFVREAGGQATLTTTRPETGQLGGARDWKMLADLGQKLRFPAEIANSRS